MKRPSLFSGEVLYVASISAILLAVGVVLSWQGKSTASATTLVLLGSCGMITAPLFPRIENLRMGLKGFALSIRREVVELVQRAPQETLTGVLPLLETDEFTVRQLTVPPRFDNKRLIDDDLLFVRRDLRLSVIAIEQPGGRWRAGGAISDEPLRVGGRLLTAGQREILDAFSTLLWTGDESYSSQLSELIARASYLEAPGTPADGRGPA